jgi:hypothetical protein
MTVVCLFGFVCHIEIFQTRGAMSWFHNVLRIHGGEVIEY